MLDFNELLAAKPHVYGKKIGHRNMGKIKKKKKKGRAAHGRWHAHTTSMRSRSNSKQLC